MTNVHTNPTHPRRGYVLLLVLFVLALAATAMAAVCRMSLAKSLQANRAEADLQRRWAVLTARSVLLPRAEKVIARSPEQGSETRREIQLAGQTYTLIFGDEQAKANVNLLYAQSGLAGAERDVRAIVAATGGGTPVELRPIHGRGKNFGSIDADDEEPPAFESFGQIFRLPSPGILTSAHGTSPSLSANLTCWGDGSINLPRASSQALRAACSGRLTAGEVTRLLDHRAKHPNLDAGELLDQLKLSDKRREKIEDLLTDESSCHSLWIISHSRGRSWYDLSVMGAGGEGEIILFSW